MGELIEKEPIDEKEKYFQLWREVSGATVEDLSNIKKLFAQLPELTGENAYDAAQTIRHFLIGQGFEYDDHEFTMQDLAKQKRGNCLGLSLLVGSLLRERGYEPKYEMLTNPKDAVYRQDLKYFEELTNGDYFNYDNPVLPKLSDQAENPTGRFAPLEHPRLVLDDKPFETTSLEEQGDDPGIDTDAERKISVSFEDIASNVYVDRIKTLLGSPGYNLEELKILCDRAINLSKDNREAYKVLWDIAELAKDEELKAKALREYQRVDGDDSRYHFQVYEMTGDDKHLDISLEKSPSYIIPFFWKNVVWEHDDREARFNLAVTAWCIANSNVLDLNNFYGRHRDQLERLFGKDAIKAA